MLINMKLTHKQQARYNSFLFFPFNTYLLSMWGASVFYEFILLVYAVLDGTPAGTKGLWNEIIYGIVAGYNFAVLESVSGCCQVSLCSLGHGSSS